MSTQFDIAIVGAGITGACAAIAADRLGLSVALIDASRPEPPKGVFDRNAASDYSPRVSAITPANAEWLASLGIWNTIEPTALPYRGMQVWDELGTAQIQFDAHDYRRTELGYIVENPSILAACLSAISDRSNITQFFEERVERFVLSETQSHYDIQMQSGKGLSCRLLVGADGANSIVRRALNLPTREWDYEQNAIVCTVQTEQSHQFTAWQRFSETGPLAFLPLRQTSELSDEKGQFSSIVWSLDTDKSKEIFALADQPFCEALQREIEGRLGKIESVSQRFMFPLRQRHAKRYIGQRGLVLGDAAHTIHPLAGQGLNLGLADVQALAEVLRDAQQQAIDCGHQVLLKRYQRQRQSENLAMMLGMEGFKRLFGTSDPLLRLARNIGVGLVDKHTFIKRQFATKAMGL